MRKVSLFSRAGGFLEYVEVKGKPRVIVREAAGVEPTRYFVAFDAVSPTNSFREVEAELVQDA